MKGWTAPPGTDGSLLGGRYELVHHIARGGMGDVFEATDHQLSRQVAVKRFRGSSPQDGSRFDTEVLALARLNHPNLVQVYDSGEHEGVAFLVMELVDGPSLQTILQTRVSLPATEVAALGAGLADALDYVHHKGVVHRDVAPANVLCGSDGRPRLADFGIARLVDTSRITAVATTIGTAAYMAPEQLEGHDVTPAADVYSLGLVLLEALAGRRGFEGTSSEVAVARLVRDPDTSTGVPTEWTELLQKMTARDPASRPTAGRVRDTLAALAASGASTGSAGTAAAAVATLARDGSPGAAAVDPLAQTRPVPVAGAGTAVGRARPDGGTAVMPVVAAPAGAVARPGSRRGSRAVAPRGAGGRRRRPSDPRGRQLAWLIVAGLVVALLMGLASRSSGGADQPTGTTAVAVEEPAPTTAAPTTTVAPAPPPAPVEPRGEEGDDDEGKGNEGKGNEGKGNEGKGEDDD